MAIYQGHFIRPAPLTILSRSHVTRPPSSASSVRGKILARGCGHAQAAGSRIQAADRGLHAVDKVQSLVHIARQVETHPRIDLLSQRLQRARLSFAALLVIRRVCFPVHVQRAQDRLAHLFVQRLDAQLVDGGRFAPRAGRECGVGVAALVAAADAVGLAVRSSWSFLRSFSSLQRHISCKSTLNVIRHFGLSVAWLSPTPGSCQKSVKTRPGSRSAASSCETLSTTTRSCCARMSRCSSARSFQSQNAAAQVSTSAVGCLLRTWKTWSTQR